MNKKIHLFKEANLKKKYSNLIINIQKEVHINKI